MPKLHHTLERASALLKIQGHPAQQQLSESLGDLAWLIGAHSPSLAQAHGDGLLAGLLLIRRSTRRASPRLQCAIKALHRLYPAGTRRIIRRVEVERLWVRVIDLLEHHIHDAGSEGAPKWRAYLRTWRDGLALIQAYPRDVVMTPLLRRPARPDRQAEAQFIHDARD